MSIPTCQPAATPRASTFSEWEMLNPKPDAGQLLPPYGRSKRGFPLGPVANSRDPGATPRSLPSTSLTKIDRTINRRRSIRFLICCATPLIGAGVIEVAEPDVGAALPLHRIVRGAVNLNLHTLKKRLHVIHSFSVRPPALHALSHPANIHNPRSLGRFTPRYDRDGRAVPEGCGRGCSTRKIGSCMGHLQVRGDEQRPRFEGKPHLFDRIIEREGSALVDAVFRSEVEGFAFGVHQMRRLPVLDHHSIRRAH